MKNEQNHIDLIRSEFQYRSSKNTAYSLRAFARDLGMSPGSVSQILSGKKGLSEKSASHIAKKLGLNPKESDYMIKSVVAAHGRSEKTRAAAELALEKLKTKAVQTKSLSERELGIANRWHHLAIMELLEIEPRQNEAHWFAKKLGLHIIVARKALQELEELGWIKKEAGIYYATYLQATTTFDQASRSLRALHAELLAKAGEALHSQNVNEREFLNMTLSFRSAELEQAKLAIREFQTQFAEKFYDAKAVKDSVYQLSVQFFRMDKKDVANE
jgi:uncharacterized protein (TIGR02147 family)